MTDGTIIARDVGTEIDDVGLITRFDSYVTPLASGGYIVVWSERAFSGIDDIDIMAQRFNADGTAAGASFQINTTTVDDQFLPQVAGLTGGNYVVTWSSDSGASGAGTYAQLYSSTDVPIGGETFISDATGQSVVTALPGGGYLIAWTERDSDGVNDTASVKVQKFHSTGVANGAEIDLFTESVTSSGSTLFPAVAFSGLEIEVLTGGELAVSYTRSEGSAENAPRIGLFEQTGVQIAAPVNPEQGSGFQATSLPQQQIVALGDGNVMIIYLYSFGSNGLVGVGYNEIWGRIYDDAGVAQGGEFLIQGGEDNRRFDLFASGDGEGGALVGFVTEGDSAGERALTVVQVDSSGDVAPGPIWLDQLTNFSSARAGEMTVLNDGRVVATWQTGGLGSVSELFQRFLEGGSDGRFTSGADTVVLGATGETVAALDGADNVTGGIGDDAIRGGSGGDTLDGGDGDDILVGNEGGDTLLGGLGNDFLDGGADVDFINGQDGDDEILGGAGDDVLEGGNNDDFLMGGSGSDTIRGGDGADFIYGLRNGNFSRYYLDPNDLETDAGVTNYLFGGAGDDFIYGGDGDDEIDGGEGSDRIFGDLLFGDGGNDLIIASTGDDLINGMDGFDTIDFSAIGAGIEVIVRAFPGSSATQGYAYIPAIGGDPAYRQTLYFLEHFIGTDFADTFLGYTGDEHFEGGDGDDVIEGGDGADIIDGGNGVDIASYENAAAGVQASLFTGSGVTGEAAGDTFIDIEGLTGSAFNDILVGRDGASDTLRGGEGSDGLRGNGGDDLMYGEEGADLFFSGFGADLHDGGDGVDTVLYNQANAGVIVNLTSGTGSLGHAAGDTYVSIENVIGSAFGDLIIGDGSANSIQGRAGNDTLEGRDGDDVLIGGNGADTLRGGDGFDTASYADQAAGVTASLFTGVGAGGDTFDSIERLIGTDFADILVGRDGASDTLEGGAGADALRGNGGDDTMIGGDGADLFFGGFGADSHDGGSGIDTILYNAATAGVIVRLDIGQGFFNQADGDTYTGVENVVGTAFRDALTGDAVGNTLEGRAGNDDLFGLDGSDTLLGGNGNDVLDGGRGFDVLTGGLNNDTFVFAAGYQADRITDFTNGDDVLDLTAFGFASFADVSALASQDGSDVLIDFGSGDALRLVDFDLADFDASDVMI